MGPAVCFSIAARISGMVVLTGAAVASSGCSAGRADTSRDAAATPRPVTMTVSRGSIAPRFLLTGELEAVAAANLAVPANPNGQTTIRWMADEGAIVKAGDKVVEFDTASFASDYGEKVLLRDQARSDLEQAEADGAGRLADKEFASAQKAIAVEKARIAAAIPAEFLRGREWQDNQIALSRAQTELEKAKEDLDAEKKATGEALVQGRLALEKAQREVDAAQQALEGIVLRAPRDGIFVVADRPFEGRKMQVGDAVWIGLAVASLPDLSRMRVVAKLPDVDDGRIATGMPVRCTLDAFPGREYGGRIADVMPVAQEDGRRSLRRVYTVGINLDTTNAEQMRPGMSVKVEVRVPAPPEALLAPRAGLDFSGTSPRARLASGKVVDVTIGACDESRCVVVSGLKDGDRLRSAT